MPDPSPIKRPRLFSDKIAYSMKHKHVSPDPGQGQQLQTLQGQGGGFALFAIIWQTAKMNESFMKCTNIYLPEGLEYVMNVAFFVSIELTQLLILPNVICEAHPDNQLS